MKRVHLIAICGMGMGALAGLLKARGFEVTGSDQNVFPPMSDQLAALGVSVQSGFSPENLNPAPDLVIIGNAVSRNNPEVEAVLAKGIPYSSMPQCLWERFLQERFRIVVAGTHGKTTTTGLLAWLLERTGNSPGFLVGGLLPNFGGSSQLGEGNCFVVEGDEYDSSCFDKGPKFLHYRPQILILNPIEFDHADIYRDLPHLMTSFEKLVDAMPKEGLVIAHAANSNVRSLLSRIPCRTVTFGITAGADVAATDLRLEEKIRFRLQLRGKDQGELSTPLIGRHNVENLLGVLAVTTELGIPLSSLQLPLSEFRGVKRRQEVLGTFRGVTVIDDFANHPTAIRETLRALRGRYPRARLWAIFEPRSHTTRRRIFQREFVEAFSAADRVVLGAVYQPERIPPDERLDPGQLVADLVRNGKEASYLPAVDEISAAAAREARSGDVICLMSNGSFGDLAGKLIARLQGGP